MSKQKPISLKEALRDPLSVHHRFSESIILEQTTEAARNASDARKSQYALWFKHDSLDKVATLLDYAKFMEDAAKGVKFDNFIDPYVIGYIRLYSMDNRPEIDKNVKWMVAFSAAEKGWGPLMYDVAFGMAYPSYVSSDRGSVSEFAEKVWTYILNSRPDVERIPVISKKAFLNSEFVYPDMRFGFPELRPMVPQSVWDRLRSRSELASKMPTICEVLVDIRNEIQFLNQTRDLKAGGSQGVQRATLLVRTSPEILDELLNKLVPGGVKETIDYQEYLRMVRAVKEAIYKEVLTLGTSYGYRLKAPSSAANGPALAAIIDNGKKMKEMIGKAGVIASSRDLDAAIGDSGSSFFWKKYRDVAEE